MTLPPAGSAVSPIRIVLADDLRTTHVAVAQIVRTTTDIALVGQATNGHEALALCHELKPDIVLMDVVMPFMDGVEATRLIHEQFPAIKVLALTSHVDHDSVWAMLRNGASGYVVKGSLASDLITTLRATYQGKAVFSPEVTAHLFNPLPGAPHAGFDLTTRELEVLGLIAAGMNNGEIAHDLHISQSTVKFHLNNILGKLGVTTRAEALVVAARENLV
jgi:two-component system, NarL family, response regulator LiaR